MDGLMAQVMAVSGDGFVQVNFVDFGTLEWVLGDQLRRLRRVDAALPIQGLHCSLYNAHRIAALPHDAVRLPSPFL